MVNQLISLGRWEGGLDSELSNLKFNHVFGCCSWSWLSSFKTLHLGEAKHHDSIIFDLWP